MYFFSALHWTAPYRGVFHAKSKLLCILEQKNTNNISYDASTMHFYGTYDIDIANDDANVGKKKGRCFPCHGASRVVRVHTKYTNIDSKTTSFHILSPTPLLPTPYT